MQRTGGFLEAGANLKKGDPDLEEFVTLSKARLQSRWLTPRGRSILSEWKSAGYKRERLIQLVGGYYDHLDLRGVTLNGEDLSYEDLSRIDFFASDLRGSNFHGSNLEESWLSETDLRGTVFDYADMRGVLIDNARFDDRTRFVGVNLEAINFNLAALIKDLALGQQRIAHLKSRHPVLALILRVTCDYGRSLGLFFCWVATIVILFGLAFAYLPNLTDGTGLIDGLYFSVATFTTLGYGDVKPVSDWGKALAMAEVSLGYLMGGLLVAILARKVIGN